jgi:hypothetical protein
VYGLSRRYASATARRQNGSFRHHTASSGDRWARKDSWNRRYSAMFVARWRLTSDRAGDSSARSLYKHRDCLGIARSAYLFVAVLWQSVFLNSIWVVSKMT